MKFFLCIISLFLVSASIESLETPLQWSIAIIITLIAARVGILELRKVINER
jgi:hypothetical protein